MKGFVARNYRGLLIGACVIVAVILAAMAIRSLLSQSSTARRPVTHQIALMKPPPRPPPPKPEVKPPEPEVKKEEIKIPDPAPEAPKQAEDQPPAGKDLGVDAEGAAGGDAFGLVGRKGGRDLLAGDRGQFTFYTNMIQQQLQEEFSKNKKLRAGDYRAIIKIWLAADGRIQRFELAGSTGSLETDQLLKLGLSEMPPFKSPPPENMPQPVRLRVTSRGAG